jgi:ribosomal protein S18 acetylase RimI-like enzyme
MPSEDPIHGHIRRMQENMAGHFSYLQRATEGMTVEEGDGWLLVNSGLPSDTFNILFCRDQLAAADLREAVGYFRSRQLPFAAWVGPEAPAAPILEGLGLRQTEAETGMLLDAADFRPGGLPSGLTIARVTDPVGLRAFAGVVAGQPPDAAVLQFYELIRATVLRDESPMRLFVGYWGGEPVATAEAFLSEGVGGVYSVATRDHYRRRGIGSALTAWAVREVFESGRPQAVLQASADGRGIYERLGFRSVCAFTVFQ